jgi:formylglycine-generating enzyme
MHKQPILIMMGLLAAAGLIAAAAQAVTIDLVPVANPGNPGKLAGGGVGGSGPTRLCGEVDYNYQIGKYEVTAGQYCAFLNAVAATDTYGLYNTDMWNSYGCKISRSGSSGSYIYNVSSAYANRPVNFVSWGDAARFVNWLSNGQPAGTQGLSTTEDGSYYLNGVTDKMGLMAITRKTNASWVIPTEDEWYKAAYHKNDGVTGNYWNYPTATNSAPSNDYINLDPGNNANFWILNNDYTIGSPYYMTVVGEFENSESPYGTFDQGGNVWEWNETAIITSGLYMRGIRGSAWNFDSDKMLAVNRDSVEGSPIYEFNSFGFRVAYVPEPNCLISLLSLGAIALIARARRQCKTAASISIMKYR